MADESIDARVQRLMQESGGTPSPSGTSLTPDQVEQSLDTDMGYQLSSGPERVMKRKQAFAQHGLDPTNPKIASPGKKELDESGPVHTYVRPLLEGGGMIAGGMAGAASPLPGGAMIGGALGYGLGDTASSFLERMAGERPPVASVQQGVAEAGKSLLMGGAIEQVGGIAGKLLGPLAAKVAGPFQKQYEGLPQTLDEMAQSKGITLDPHEILQSRPVAIGHKLLENVPYTSGLIQRKEEEKLKGLTKEWARIKTATGTIDRQRIGETGQKIQDTIEKELDRIGMRQGELRDQARDTILQRTGSSVSYKELGEQTQTAITQHHQGLKDLENLAWDAARSSVPQETVVGKTPTMQQVATEIKDRYINIPKFVDENLLAKLNNIKGSGNAKYDALLEQAQKAVPEGLNPTLRKTLIDQYMGEVKPGWRVADLVTLRSELSGLASEHHSGLARGDAAKGSSDTYGKIYLELRNAVDTELERFSASHGGDTADLFAAARAATGTRKSLFNAKEHPGVARAIMNDPSQIATSLIRPGSAAGYTELRNLVGPAASTPVKQSFTNSLMNVGGKEADGLPGLRRRLDQYGSQTLAEVYSPKELNDLYHLANQSTWMAHSPIGNPLFRQLVKEAPSKVAPTILGHPELTEKVLRQFPAMKQDLRLSFMEGIKPNENTLFPTRMLEHLNAYPAKVQQQLWSKQELKDFYDMAQIVERTKGTVKLAENPSGTATPLIAFSTAGAMLRHPIAAMPFALTSRSLAKIYLSPLGRTYLLEGLTTSSKASQAASLGTKILGIAGVDMTREAQANRRRVYLPTAEEQQQQAQP